MEERTIAIVACTQSGSTMLAGVLEILGVPMVSGDYNEKKWEDRDIKCNLYPELKEDKFLQAIKERNKNKVWGFKFAGGWRFMPLFKKHLRNPVFLAILRDPVATSYTRFGKSRINLHRLLNTIRVQEREMQGIKDSTRDVLIFSYEKAIAFPEKFVLDVMKRVGIKASKERVRAATSYIQPDRNYPSVKKHLT